jgi:hypothetical protein
MGSLPAIAVAAVLVFSGMMTPLRAQGNQRPLSDFLDKQGTSQCYAYPAPDQLGWGTGADKTNGNANLTPPRFALIDYTGLQAKYLLTTHKINLGTTVSGSVMERPLADGRALVTVDLQTSNALGWADGNPLGDFNTAPLIFGARVQDVAAGSTPALGNSHFHVEFVNTAPGAPLPAIPCGDPACPTMPSCPGGTPLEVDFLSVQASITGQLHAPLWPEGTPGKLDVTQIGPLKTAITNGFKGPLSDSFPVESIALRSTGK